MSPRTIWQRTRRIGLPSLAATLLLLVAACHEDVPPDAPPAPVGDAPLTQDEQQLVLEAARAVSSDRFEDAQHLLAPLLARDPVPPDAQMVAGQAAYDLGDYAESVARLQDAIARKPEFLPSMATLGFAQCKLGDFPGARQTFERIVGVNDAAYKAHYGLGFVALADGRLADARRHLERALALSPGYLKAQFQMGRLLHEEGRLDEARAALTAVLAAWPTHEEALYRLSQVLDALGQGDEAAAVLARHGQVYKAREAIGGLTQRIRSGDDRAELHAQIAHLWIKVGEAEEARRAVADGLRRFPRDPALEALRALLAHGAAPGDAPGDPKR